MEWSREEKEKGTSGESILPVCSQMTTHVFQEDDIINYLSNKTYCSNAAAQTDPHTPLLLNIQNELHNHIKRKTIITTIYETYT